MVWDCENEGAEIEEGEFKEGSDFDCIYNFVFNENYWEEEDQDIIIVTPNKRVLG